MFCNCPQQEVSALPTTVSRTAQMALQAALASPSSTAGNAADEAEPSNAISTFTRPPEPAEPEQPSPKTESSARLVCVTVCVAVMLVGGKNFQRTFRESCLHVHRSVFLCVGKWLMRMMTSSSDVSVLAQA